MSKFFESLVSVLTTIGSIMFVVAWAVTATCITFGLAIWSWTWFDSLFTNLLNSIN